LLAVDKVVARRWWKLPLACLQRFDHREG